MKKRLISLSVVVVALFAAVVSAAQPGTQEDPLVTKSYLENIIAQETQFRVVEVQAGKSVIGDAGTEMILRMGTCTVIGTQSGGVSDVTMGYDLANGTSVQGNHLLIVPRADGRGIKTHTYTLVMIKGKYTIK